MNVLSTDGHITAVVRGSRAASLVAEHANAVKRYLETGDTTLLDPFVGKRVAGLTLETDPDAIETFALSGELDFEEILRRTNRRMIMSSKKPTTPSSKQPGHIDGPDPIGADLRRARPARRIAAGSVCVTCGETDPVVLKDGRSVLEAHHIAGRANDPDTTADVCLNCHRKLTNAQRDAGVPLAADPDRSILERLVALFRGLAVFFQHLAKSLAEAAHQLERCIGGLDREHPGWRSLPEAS
jgi:hypothetical protein